MSVERDIRFDLIARLCPNTTGAELRSVATEVRPQSYGDICIQIYITPKAGMFAIRARRKVATERDFLDAVEKVVRQGTKFSSTYVSLFFSHTAATDLDGTDRYTRYTISRVALDS